MNVIKQKQGDKWLVQTVRAFDSEKFAAEYLAAELSREVKGEVEL